MLATICGVFAISTSVFLALYLKLKTSSHKELEELRTTLEKNHQETYALEERIANAAREDGGKVEALLREIDELRKEKEQELKLRLEAEKQIDVTLQKTEDIQKRMDDWKLVQDSAMRDSREAISKMGDDIYSKLNESFHMEVEENKHIFDEFSQNLNKITGAAIAVPKVTINESESVAKKPVKLEKIDGSKTPNTPLDDSAKQFVDDIIDTAKAVGKAENENYFTTDSLKSKLMLAEFALIDDAELTIFDFKSLAYFDFFNETKDQKLFKHKLEKYFNYISNAKYLASVKKAIAKKNEKFKEAKIIAVVHDDKDLSIVKKLGYDKKMAKLNISIMNVQEIDDLII